MNEDDQLETILSGWRSRHGPVVHRSRGTKMVEIVRVSYEDGRAGELTREAGKKAWTLVRDPDQAPPAIDWASLPAHVRQAAEPVHRVARPAKPTSPTPEQG